jgi:hypothetical protein
MSEESKAAPTPEQIARANKLRETISDIKRGAPPEAKTPRDFTERAADKAADDEKSDSR